ncbi:hypothetical protein KM043_012412 [Ampulex compressa]|nr:hypothetical protein KM043_012412 [Ampulex compressa]
MILPRFKIEESPDQKDTAALCPFPQGSLVFRLETIVELVRPEISVPSGPPNSPRYTGRCGPSRVIEPPPPPPPPPLPPPPSPPPPPPPPPPLLPSSQRSPSSPGSAPHRNPAGSPSIIR